MKPFVLKILVSLLLFVFLSTAPVLAQQTSKASVVRNHYVLLIDGSGSNVRGQARRTAFYSMLRDTLSSFLFEKGFSPEIAPYNPEQDLISICDFGIVDGRTVKMSAAREALERYNFKRDFVHVRAKRQPHWTIKKFQAEIVPRTWYQIQVANWALPLAMLSLRSEDNYLVENTFVIMVTDGERYEDDFADEETQAFRYGDPVSVRWAGDNSVEFKKKYMRSGDPKSGRPAAWSSTLPAGEGARVFAELYYLESKRGREWKAELARIKASLEFQKKWKGGEEDAHLQITAQLTGSFEKALKAGTLEAVTLEFTRALNFVQAELTQPGAFSATIPVAEVPCEEKDVDCLFSFVASMNDPVLGKMAYRGSQESSLGKLKAPFCESTVASILTALKIPAAGVLLLFFGLVTFRWTQGRGNLPIGIRARHQLSEIALARMNDPTVSECEPIYSTILPKAGAEAFRIVPKSVLMQKILLPNTKLQIQVENGYATSAALADYLTVAEELPLPISGGENLIARWKEGVRNPVQVVLTVVQNEQRISRMKIAFPRSEPS